MLEEDLIAEERKTPICVWYLQFCDADRPVGTQFLGCCFVWARGPITAMRTSHFRECNPGGKISAGRVPVPVDKKWMNCLLTEQQISSMDAEMDARGD